jgi:hypothetical protein
MAIGNEKRMNDAASVARFPFKGRTRIPGLFSALSYIYIPFVTHYANEEKGQSYP